MYQQIKINNIIYSPEDILSKDTTGEAEYLQKIFAFLKEWFSDSPFVRVKTSGSTGAPKEFLAEKEKMIQSALMTCRFFNLQPQNNALLCMSTDYIAGKMMVVRAIVSGFNLVCAEPSGNPMKHINEHINFAAMVPMQVYNILKNDKKELDKIGHLIIGGGKIHQDLEQQIQSLPCQVWATYGMTETLSHIALRKVNGNNASPFYTPFDGVRLSLSEKETLDISAPLVCNGTLHTNDVAHINPDGTFEILGRIDNTICSGGIKIQLEILEEKLQSVFDFPFAATSVPDEKFGETLSLIVVTNMKDSEIQKNAKSVLPKYWLPKQIIHCTEIPMTETAKPNRKAIKEIARKYNAL